MGRGLNAPLGSRMRVDGRMQLTYNNIPLYYYHLDKKP
jgi:predicted lipoprotein with Yx(FWY)xxD motif